MSSGSNGKETPIIRVRSRRIVDWEMVADGVLWVIFIVAALWLLLGWIFLLTGLPGACGSCEFKSAPPIHVPWIDGLLLWLGPYILVGVPWLLGTIFEWSFENPYKRIHRQ